MTAARSRRPQPTEEEMRAALEEELKRVRVEQVVTEATVSILNVAVLRAGLVPGSEGERDLGQTWLGIEAVRALLPLVEEALGAEQARPIRDALVAAADGLCRRRSAGGRRGREGCAAASRRQSESLRPKAPEPQPEIRPALGPGRSPRASSSAQGRYPDPECTAPRSCATHSATCSRSRSREVGRPGSSRRAAPYPAAQYPLVERVVRARDRAEPRGLAEDSHGSSRA